MRMLLQKVLQQLHSKQQELSSRDKGGALKKDHVYFGCRVYYAKPLDNLPNDSV